MSNAPLIPFCDAPETVSFVTLLNMFSPFYNASETEIILDSAGSSSSTPEELCSKGMFLSPNLHEESFCSFGLVFSVVLALRQCFIRG